MTTTNDKPKAPRLTPRKFAAVSKALAQLADDFLADPAYDDSDGITAADIADAIYWLEFHYGTDRMRG